MRRDELKVVEEGWLGGGGGEMKNKNEEKKKY